MARSIRCVIAFIISTILGVGVVHYLVYPTLLQYERFENVMNRFGYTKETLIVFVVLSCWFLYLQIEFRHFSMLYLYLFYSVYLFLLFVVLFTKAPEYHTFNGDLFDFLVWDRGTLIEAFLNLAYFIPLGGLYGLRANWLEFILISLLTITGIETIQYVFYIGTFSVSDILLNFLGCLVGYSSCLLIRKFLTKPAFK
ncbi:VanZ family protein [Tetragenococcus halophilus]|uniref:VanZ family protein n=1 Tax=Tetragenococcus halophilus TaxID=51669 RepID=UPI000CC210EE|nr:VanZ family protein [Tetragenococcus halophilus]MDN6184970.1 VanZ family protein [Lactococcus lactis]MDN6497266.1 VanZ family protein [Tetragenococcus koreensis]MDN6641205.1 VanZ family protein [Tetragenococcus sp.]MCF1675658.1 VanZ family protein [Tetragenococcus halophilus]MCF1684689.1 VanZ family protein [Tetragenococcus halophilus]